VLSFTDTVEWVIAFFEDQPTAYLDEAQQAIYDEFEVETSERAIYRLLERRNWSRKVVQQRAAQQCRQLRSAWRAQQIDWSIDDICFLDESASNERTGDRKRGYSLVGLPALGFVPLKRSERWSVLPALTSKGFLDNPLIYQGGVNTELFNNWVELSVFPQLVPMLAEGRQPRIILDNASIHRSKELRELCAAHGVELSHLPPYSPDMNPIEKVFNMLKAWIRRNYLLVHEFHFFGAFMHFAMQQLRVDEVAVRFIQASGYTNGLDEREEPYTTL
jgi:hypothetical protein